MRVAVAGATGVLGRAAMPALAEAGHQVRGLARNVPAGRYDLARVDILDCDAVVAFAREWRPEAVIHLATTIPARLKPWGVERQFAATNRLRTEGTRNLIAAAAEAGAERLVTQSIAFVCRPGPGLGDEGSPLWTDGPFGNAPGVIAELERMTTEAGGVALRFGQLHGPGTFFAADGALGRAAGQGMLPVVHRGGRESTFSFCHPRDGARAIVAALERDARGVINVVDDEPALVSEWLPVLARARGAKHPPRRMPAALLRPVLGAYNVAFMTELRGADNSLAKKDLGWEPTTSWREGFAEG